MCSISWSSGSSPSSPELSHATRALYFSPLPDDSHLSLAVYKVYDTTTLDAAFVTLTKDRPDALMIPANTFLVSQRSRIAQFAIEKRLPSVYSFREYIDAGGLVAYTPNYDDLFRRARG